MTDQERFAKELRRLIGRPGSMVGVVVGDSVVTVAKTVAKRLVSNGDIVAARDGSTAQGVRVLVLCSTAPSASAPKAGTVEQAPDGTFLQWSSPGGIMGRLGLPWK